MPIGIQAVVLILAAGLLYSLAFLLEAYAIYLLYKLW